MDSEVAQKRPQFGGRVLGEGEDVFKHNAWDNVEWDTAQEEAASEAVRAASTAKMSEAAAQDFEDNADKYWDTFYGIHQNRFFKDRNWLFTEFPDLAPKYRGARERIYGPTLHNLQSGDQHTTIENGSPNPEERVRSKATQCETKISANQVTEDSDAKRTENEDEVLNQDHVQLLRNGEDWMGQNSSYRILEVGCGTGSTVYPILEVNTDPGVMVYCCDLSATAVNLVKEHKEFSQQRCFSFVCDVTKDWSEVPFLPASLDVITLIFVLSAVHPDKMANVASKMFHYMKPGGQVFFRDYGRYDLAQLRFKKGKCIQDNFYARGDGTRCYFFTQEEITQIFTSAGFTQTQNIVDRRLQVNRGKKLKMYRVWIQAKFVKPLE